MQQGEGTVPAPRDRHVNIVCPRCGDSTRHQCALRGCSTSDRESDTRCDTAAPSDEAVDAALSMFARMLHPSRVPDRHAVQWALSAAMPRREAEVRAEERAATLREVERLRGALAQIEGLTGAVDGPAIHGEPTFGRNEVRAIARAALAHFNPEAE